MNSFLKKISVLGSLLIAVMMAGTAADAKSLGGALSSIKPSKKLQQGQCDITIDCPNYRVMVNGKKAGEIICGRQTGQSFRKGKLDTKIIPAGGKILPAGFPMLATKPMLCNNCFIHVYPWTGPGSKSLGCVGVQEKGWNEILKCGGSDFTMIPMGAKSPNVASSNSSSSSSNASSSGTNGRR